MARLLIYDAYENKVYTYANLNENDPMPYRIPKFFFSSLPSTPLRMTRVEKFLSKK
jgi:hypothetical protein